MPRRKQGSDADDSGNNRDNRNNNRVIEWQRAERAKIQDVATEFGPQLSDGPGNPQRRERCQHDLSLFATTYFPKVFAKKFSPAHLQAFDLIQSAIQHRDKYAFAMPRGSGKSSICEVALHWASIYGFSRFTVLVNATKEMAEERVEDIKMAWLNSEILLEDFPEVACPFRHMQGETRRCRGQHYLGEPTLILWEKRRLVLPTIDVPYAQQKGAIIQTAGITGNLRGRNKTTKDSEKLRPDLVLCDDPQTEQSAASANLTRKRVKALTKAIDFLGGTTKSCGVVIPCTIIEPDDLADQFLDRKRNPEYHGQKTKMLISFPTNMDLWHKYYEIRTEALIDDHKKYTIKTHPATKFYKANRAKMDAGAEVMWPEGFDAEKAISAIEFAMQIFLKDPASFYSEFQNDPQEEQSEGSFSLKAADIEKKFSGVPRGLVPHGTTHLVAQIDVQKPVLFWTVVAFRDGFTGDIVDYGSWPEQGARHFTLSTLRKTLRQAYPKHGDEAALLRGLQDLFAHLCSRNWQSHGESNQVLSITQVGVDENYQTKIVHDAIRTSDYRNVIMPYRGLGITAAQMPLNHPKKTKKDGEIIGDFWRIVPNRGGIKTLQSDVNHWKTFVASRLTTPRGDTGAICLPNEKSRHNDMLVEQLVSEHSSEITNETYGRTVQQWTLKKLGTDNHWWDCLVGCCVQASLRGLKLGGLPTVTAKRKPKFKRSVYE